MQKEKGMRHLWEREAPPARLLRWINDATSLMVVFNDESTCVGYLQDATPLGLSMMIATRDEDREGHPIKQRFQPAYIERLRVKMIHESWPPEWEQFKEIMDLPAGEKK